MVRSENAKLGGREYAMFVPRRRGMYAILTEGSIAACHSSVRAKPSSLVFQRVSLSSVRPLWIGYLRLDCLRGILGQTSHFGALCLCGTGF